MDTKVRALLTLVTSEDQEECEEAEVEGDGDHGEGDETEIGGEDRDGGMSEELNCCKGRLDAFGNELKLILAEVTIITQWIQQQFGVQLVNQESLLFKHIYDLDEIEEIASGMSFPRDHTPIPLPLSTIPRASKTTRGKRSVGRPKKNQITTQTPTTSTSTSTSKKSLKGQGQGHSSKLDIDDESDGDPTPTPPPTDWNPQDFVETVYEKKDGKSGRPRRASTRKVNYKEGHSRAHDDFVDSPSLELSLEGEELPFDLDQDEDEDYKESEPEEGLGMGVTSASASGSSSGSKVKKEKEGKSGRKPRGRRKGKKDLEGEGGETEGGGGATDVHTPIPPEDGVEKVKVKGRQENWESKGPKQCDECGKVVMGTSSLKKHKMMHADERPYPCPECGKTFRDKKNVKIHLIALHNGERHLQCSFCGRKFYAPKDLRIHERTHTGDKPYPCHLCPKRFNVKEHLTMHIRVHTGERPYVCPTCGKAFSQANSLRIHKKIHLKEKEPTPRRARKPKAPLQLIHHLLPENTNSSSGMTDGAIVGVGGVTEQPLLSMTQHNFVIQHHQQQQQQQQHIILDQHLQQQEQQQQKFVQIPSSPWRMAPFGGYSTDGVGVGVGLGVTTPTPSTSQSPNNLAPTNLSLRPPTPSTVSSAQSQAQGVNSFPIAMSGQQHQLNDPRYFYM